MRLKNKRCFFFGGRQMERGFHLTADGLGKTRKRLQRETMNVNLPLYKKQLPGLEEAGVNQATPWPESGVEPRKASSVFCSRERLSRESKVFFVIRKGQSREQRICR